MAGIIHLRLHSFGNLEFITRIPMSLQAGLGGDIINFVICVAAFFVIGYLVAYVMIGKLNLATPGRLGNYTDDNADDSAADAKTEKKRTRRPITVRPSASSPCWAAGRTSCWWTPA